MLEVLRYQKIVDKLWRAGSYMIVQVAATHGRGALNPGLINLRIGFGTTWTNLSFRWKPWAMLAMNGANFQLHPC